MTLKKKNPAGKCDGLISGTDFLTVPHSHCCSLKRNAELVSQRLIIFVLIIFIVVYPRSAPSCWCHRFPVSSMWTQPERKSACQVHSFHLIKPAPLSAFLSQWFTQSHATSVYMLYVRAMRVYCISAHGRMGAKFEATPPTWTVFSQISCFLLNRVWFLKSFFNSGPPMSGFINLRLKGMLKYPDLIVVLISD